MALKKVIRYISIYGVRRTLIKVAGRSRSPFLKVFFPDLFFKRRRDISLIGCGQFGFSTISFFLLSQSGNRFLECFDIDQQSSDSTSKFYGYKVNDPERIVENPKCSYLYIASNHHSHTPYAIEGLKRNLRVYIEKPISVNWGQFRQLLKVIGESGNVPYVGYNRPFSAAILKLGAFINSQSPVTLNCFITGHKIGVDHWYRNPEEGTRVCGNIGHWLDLSIHLFNKRGFIPTSYNVSISNSSELEIDDNLSISITTEFNDLVVISLSSREEPFEGINETINFQSADVIAKIDDFRKMTIWKSSELHKFRYWPKDVGHKNAILQPFKEERRDFTEIEVSTVLMLSITDMVKSGEKTKEIYPFAVLENLKSDSIHI